MSGLYVLSFFYALASGGQSGMDTIAESKVECLEAAAAIEAGFESVGGSAYANCTPFEQSPFRHKYLREAREMRGEHP